jgi:beta-N-acetylhexosaminidase
VSEPGSGAALPDVSDLTLEEKVGQLLCLGWGGDDSLLAVNAQARACVAELHAGGMVVMARNVSPPGVKPVPPVDAPGVRAMLDELQGLARVPLLVATDQEGGRVARFGSEPFTRMPPALAFGEDGRPALARLAARAVGRELRAVGVNWNFAPVADVNSNPENPVIGDRAFGDTPLLVGPMVLGQVQGYQEAGVLACAKHFPGHGDTALDSHYDLPTVPYDLEEMAARELLPFVVAIQGGVASIMTAHILFPAVDDSGLPATMSRRILTELLRQDLGFDGLIVTDCLEMKAVADRWGTARAALLAVQAGADVVLVCHTGERQRETYQTLLDAARSGELPLSRLDDAVGRVLAAKQKVLDTPAPGLEVIGSEEHRAVRARLTSRSGDAGANPAPTTLGETAPG